ncbi:hypothetical protein EV193_110258 [Herbihabitans rhizosphaerae]|uniref:Secreted protein n=1 Tax=Herbihabitans rhizosphaerae TaxID=1872711 RepID=A0A4Q7KJP7_9PSEU|nr:hypothetical protein [Herbihabitans rhizosphaerae]RZS34106.1 hypothetical protein EV193_110258 [Herbihabitans rhizosphaerae]
MRIRRSLAFLAIAVMATFSMMGTASATSAATPAGTTEAAALDCTPHSNTPYLRVFCKHNGVTIANGHLIVVAGGPALVACDYVAGGGRYVVESYVEWRQGTNLLRTSILDDNPQSCRGKMVPIPDGTKVEVWVCVRDHGCSARASGTTRSADRG